MTIVPFQRRIHIPDLYLDVHHWLSEQQERGFVKLTPELCDTFALADPEWIEETEWLDAMGQYIYVEYIISNENGGVGEVRHDVSIEKLMEQHNGINLNIRSSEDDFYIEILASDIMVRYCSDKNNDNDYWKLTVKETAILLKLYMLNGKSEKKFWEDLLSLNKTLGIINEQPLVRYYLNGTIVKSLEYSPAVPLPEAQTNDFVELQYKGEMKKFFVEEKVFSYSHPMGWLGEVKIKLFH